MPISVSPLSAVRRRILSFDTRLRAEAFDYSFTRLFGVEEDHDPAPLRAHVLLLPARGEEALDSAVGFSFPFCGSSTREWTLELALECLRTQAVEFSHHLGDLDVTELLARFWDLAHFYVTGSVDESGVRHLVIRIVANLSQAPGYVCIHEDSQAEREALAMASRHWDLVRGSSGVSGGQTRSRSDGDYSPSKPVAKARRMADVSATSSPSQSL